MARVQAVSYVLIVIFLNLFLLTFASPSSVVRRKNHSLERRYQGKATWFKPNTGACGDVNSNKDFIVAMNYLQYDHGAPCHKVVVITNTSNNRVVKAKVTDECPSCAYGSLDLSPATFEALGDLETGILPIMWYWA